MNADEAERRRRDERERIEAARTQRAERAARANRARPPLEMGYFDGKAKKDKVPLTVVGYTVATIVVLAGIYAAILIGAYILGGAR